MGNKDIKVSHYINWGKKAQRHGEVSFEFFQK